MTPTRKPNRASFKTYALAAIALAVLPTAPVWAQDAATNQQPAAQAEQRYRFSIPAKPLPQAIADFSAVTGVQVLYTEQKVADVAAPALTGSYTANEALQRLLAGSGFSYRFTDANSVTLMAQQQGERTLLLEPITVTGARAGGSAFAPVEGYQATHSYTATMTDTPILETPVSVQVVPRQVMEDQAAQRLEDVYINVSGVVGSGNTLNAQSEVLPVIRGFETPIVLRNGMRATTVGAVDLVNIESVEVLKGPASILFGALEPGGVLNYVTKRPLAESSHKIKQEVGSYDHFRTTLDSTGPLTEAGNLLYRINAAYTNSGSFRDEIDLERYAIAPSFTWLVTEDTDVNFDFSYTREEVPLDSGIPLGTDGKPLVPDNTFFGDPSLDGRTLEDWFASLSLNHRFNEVFTLQSRFQYHLSEPRNEAIRHRGVVGAPGAEELRQRFQKEDRTDEAYQLVTNLQAKFATGGIEHNALLGVDLIRQELVFERFRQNLPNVPITSNPNVSFTLPPGTQLERDFDEKTKWVAVYFQDQLALLPGGRLKLLLGGRFDYVEQEDNLGSNDSDDSEFTWRAGALYQLNDWISPYASVTQSFRPQGLGTQDRSGNQIAPETGMQYEAGLKFAFFDERLTATTSVFKIDKEDVAVFDNQFFIDTGENAFFPGVDQRSQGVEVDISGELSPGLRVIANFAYTDTEETENLGDPSRVGQRLGNVPDWSARAWLAYDFPSTGMLNGLGVGGGIRYESDRLTQFDNQIELDDFVVFDAAAWYHYPLGGGRNLKAQINLRNLTDTRFVTRASDQSIAHPGTPFRVIGSISLEF